MNVAIRDVEAIRAIRPVDAALYLRANGWTQQDPGAEKSSIWGLERGRDRFEALLSMDSELRDYSLRMGDLLAVLAIAEGRSQFQVYSDLLTVTADVLHIRVMDPDLVDGSMPIEQYAQMAQKARDLVLAAACAATERRPVWHKRKPDQAMNYVRRVRVGQSSRGSYVMNVISRVMPRPGQKSCQIVDMGCRIPRLVRQDEKLRYADHEPEPLGNALAHRQLQEPRFPNIIRLRESPKSALDQRSPLAEFQLDGRVVRHAVTSPPDREFPPGKLHRVDVAAVFKSPDR